LSKKKKRKEWFWGRSSKDNGEREGLGLKKSRIKYQERPTVSKKKSEHGWVWVGGGWGVFKAKEGNLERQKRTTFDSPRVLLRMAGGE